jgi:hypothetical protein
VKCAQVCETEDNLFPHRCISEYTTMYCSKKLTNLVVVVLVVLIMMLLNYKQCDHIPLETCKCVQKAILCLGQNTNPSLLNSLLYIFIRYPEKSHFNCIHVCMLLKVIWAKSVLCAMFKRKRTVTFSVQDLRLPWQWRCLLWSPGLWHHVNL